MSTKLAARFTRFAEVEAKGRSPLYEQLARAVAVDGAALAFLVNLPSDKQQPNLLFAALRHLFGTPVNAVHFLATLHDNEASVRALMLARRTQTNEPGRCAALLPVLAGLPEPIALIEVGASAGLCLLVDRYGYDYGGHRLPAPLPGAPVFACRANAGMTLPGRVPEIVWRAGLDLNPIDVTDDAQTAWLETLVWPEQPDRLERLRAAIAVARADPPRVVQGDLLADLPALAAGAPAGATLVVFHTAVLAYVASAVQRNRFGAIVHDLGAVWISNEAAGVLADIDAKQPHAGPPGAFLLACDGEPLAWTDPHGAWIDWIGGR